jgi:hypothetical protein
MLKGLAGPASDVDRVRAKWFYDYGVSVGSLSDFRYVPMLRDGLPNASLPASWPGFILVLNEPDNVEPYGAHINPTVAVQRVIALQAAYPKARMYVGGCTELGGDWNAQFQSLYHNQTGSWWTTWHQHVYFENYNHEHYDFNSHIGHLLGAMASADANFAFNWWITECGMVDFPPETWGPFMDVLARLPVSRFAAYTSRLTGQEAWCPPGWAGSNIPLVSQAGQLTASGQIFAYWL